MKLLKKSKDPNYIDWFGNISNQIDEALETFPEEKALDTSRLNPLRSKIYSRDKKGTDPYYISPIEIWLL